MSFIVLLATGPTKSKQSYLISHILIYKGLFIASCSLAVTSRTPAGGYASFVIKPLWGTKFNALFNSEL